MFHAPHSPFGFFRNQLTFLSFVLVSYLSVSTMAAQVTIPSTPAGHVLSAWLNVMNNGAPAELENYVNKVDPSESVAGMTSDQDETGGFDLLSIESSQPLHIRFKVKVKKGSTIIFGNLIVSNTKPAMVTSFGLSEIPPGVTAENVTLDSTIRARVIDGVESNLTDSYVDANVAKQMVQNLEQHREAGAYEGITDGDAFAKRLTEILQAVSHDKHVAVWFNPFKTPAKKERTPEDVARINQELERKNCAFQKVEVLPGNIGYLQFSEFLDPDMCGPRVVAAMSFLAHTDALIFDLRDNGGGDPAMVTFMASYLFDKSTHLNDLYNRKENSTRQYWTEAYVPGTRMATQPVFVLMSKRTFSGAEEFSYDLKNQKRATLVGETTGGGAHPEHDHVLADYFMIAVPYATAINPVSKTSWEGTGVEPDVKVRAVDALKTAEKLALDRIQKAP